MAAGQDGTNFGHNRHLAQNFVRYNDTIRQFPCHSN